MESVRPAFFVLTARFCAVLHIARRPDPCDNDPAKENPTDSCDLPGFLYHNGTPEKEKRTEERTGSDPGTDGPGTDQKVSLKKVSLKPGPEHTGTAYIANRMMMLGRGWTRIQVADAFAGTPEFKRVVDGLKN